MHRCQHGCTDAHLEMAGSLRYACYYRPDIKSKQPVNREFTKSKSAEIRERKHGGNVSAAAAEFGVPVEDWLDLSTGINPTTYSSTDLADDVLRNLPTPGEVEELLAAARSFYRVPAHAGIIAAPGTQAILQTLPRQTPKSNIAVLSPTYNEHPHCWIESGHNVRQVERFEELANGDIAVLVNPNNPDGRQIPTEDIRQLAERTGLVIVDEAFGDLSPELSVVPHCGAGNILVLRSVGKFFGLAGLRLGFAVGPHELLDELQKRLGPWAVGGPAIKIGRRALSDETWISDMRLLLEQQRRRLDEVLEDAGLEIIGGTDLFRLIDARDAQEIYRRLGKNRILSRRFDDHPTWLRLGLPGSDEALQRFQAALKS